MHQATTKNSEISERMAEMGGSSIVTESLPLLALRHSPEALQWVRREKGWTMTELARASSLPLSTISELENGTQNPDPATIAKLAAALQCPPVVIEAGQINEVATSAASALEMLERLLSSSDPAYLTRRHGFVQIGFLASGRHIGSLQIRESDFKELLNTLRRHFPKQPSKPIERRQPLKTTD